MLIWLPLRGSRATDEPGFYVFQHSFDVMDVHASRFHLPAPTPAGSTSPAASTCRSITISQSVRSWPYPQNCSERTRDVSDRGIPACRL